MYRNGGATGDSDKTPAQDARATTQALVSAASATRRCTANTAQWMCSTGETILAAEPYQPAFNDVCTTATQWIPNPIAIDNMKTLRYFFLLVDIGFIAYWLITAFHVLPAEYLYNDYTNTILVRWNWSFFPLDIAISSTGLYTLYLLKKGNGTWKVFALISLILTSVSGLQAISYWVLAKDFDPLWWAPNVFLLLYPLLFIPKLIKQLQA